MASQWGIKLNLACLKPQSQEQFVKVRWQTKIIFKPVRWEHSLPPQTPVGVAPALGNTIGL